MGEYINKLSRRSDIIRMTFLFTSLYLISYITRINYGSVISEIVRTEGMPKSEASLALTASAVTYGIGQILSGFLADRMNPKKLILYALIVTILMNLLIPFCNTSTEMVVLWAMNGLAQAFMWPTLIRIMTVIFHPEDYTRSCLMVSLASSFGTMLVYILSPVCIYLRGWKMIFFVSAFLASVMAAIWVKQCPNIAEKGDKKINDNGTNIPGRVYIVLGIAVIAISLQGILRDGVTTWMPSYITDTFHLDNKFAILSGVVLPIISIIVTQLTSLIYRRKIKTELTLASVMFFGGFLSSILMFANHGESATLSVALAAVLSGCMHGANWIMTSMIPPHFVKFGHVSFVAGFLNFSTYIGSAISAYGIAVFSEQYGWKNTLCIWSMIALAGCMLCFFAGIYWRKIRRENCL